MSKAIELVQSNPYLLALIILIGSVLLAVIVNFITTRVLTYLARKTKTMVDDEIVAAIEKPLFFSVVFIGAGFSLGALNPTASIKSIVNKILITLAILIWARAGGRIGKAFLDLASRRAGEHNFVQTRTIPLFDILIKTLLFGGVAYGVLLAWNVDVTAWLASAGIIGIAIGFAAKDTLANLFSGIFILADTPYKIGDYVLLDTGERGQVTDIGIRSTRLLTRDDIQIIVPNAAIGNAKIVNETGGPSKKERVRVKVGVAYGSDIDKVREVLLDVASTSQYVQKEPEPRVRFRQFGESALQFQLMGWIEEPRLRGRALDELNTQVYKRFGKEGIKIPFPQRDVHMKKD